MLGELVHDQHPKLTIHRAVSQTPAEFREEAKTKIFVAQTCSETTRLACSAKQATSLAGLYDAYQSLTEASISAFAFRNKKLFVLA